MTYLNDLVDDLHNQFDEIVQNRRYLHQHPELSFEEKETPQFIATHLREYDIEVQENIGDRGVVGIIHGEHPGKTIALRADFDALPIHDQKDVPYKSTVSGIMHACGHDGHTASLLAVSKVLQKHKKYLHGTVKVIFQHAEEKPPGGAKFMIEDGVLNDVDYVFGAHLATEFPIGKLATRAGASMASVDAFKVTILGKGGHGARPHETKDSIVAITQLVQQLQQIVSRRINPTEAAVVTVGSIHAGNAFNVIADTAELEGTVRALNKDVRVQIEEEIRAILEGLKIANHVDYDLEYLHGYPVLINPEKETRLVENLIKKQFGQDSFIHKQAVLGAEDFAYYLQKRPGAYFHVGAHNDDPATQFPHHHPNFDFDEKALLNIGVTFLSIINHYLIDIEK